jgi:hypothetical protein
MISVLPPVGYAVGWDVGAWNCDKNPNSRDALVVLDEAGQCAGKPWRGNLRTHINAAADTTGSRQCCWRSAACRRVIPPSR